MEKLQMATLQTLINNIDYFYEITKIPMFILNKNKIIDHYPQFFFHLPKDCFKYLINSSMTRWGKVGILSSKSDITFFIIYEEYTVLDRCYAIPFIVINLQKKSFFLII